MSKYECHVTIDPILDDKLRDLTKKIIAPFGFHLAELVMVKGKRSPKDSFMTARGENYKDIVERTERLLQELQIRHFKVRRYKIELTLMDSRAVDELGAIWV